MDDAELNEKDEEINSNHRSRRIQSIGGGSPLIKKSNSALLYSERSLNKRIKSFWSTSGTNWMTGLGVKKVLAYT